MRKNAKRRQKWKYTAYEVVKMHSKRIIKALEIYYKHYNYLFDRIDCLNCTNGDYARKCN